MYNKRGNHLPRNNTLKSTRRQPTVDQPLAPSVSVERQEIWESPEDKEKYWKTVRRAISKSSPVGDKHKSRLIRPEALRLTQVRHEVLAERTRDLYRLDQRDLAMERLACLLLERLYDLTHKSPPEICVKLGELACVIKEDTPKRKFLDARPDFVVSAQLEEWRGVRKKYPLLDDEGTRSAMGQFAAEQLEIKKAFPEINPWLVPDDIVVDPHTEILGPGQPLPTRDMVKFNLMIEESGVLSSMKFGEPLICLRTGADIQQITQFSVSDLDVLNPLALH